MTRGDGMRDAEDGEQALAAAGSLGPFFAVDGEPAPGWTSWNELVGTPGPLERRVTEVRTLLASGPGSPDVEPRVAASIVHLGLVARLVSPLLGAALVTGLLPVAGAAEVQVGLTGANPLPLVLHRPAAVRVGSTSDLVGLFDRRWHRPVLAPLATTVGGRYALSPRVLQGNVASAVAAALRAAAVARRDLRPRTEEWLVCLLVDGPLRGAGRLLPDATFVRRSCCLFYRVPGAGTCADCVLGRL